MSIIKVMLAMYDSGINCSIQTIYNIGFDISIGDYIGGHIANKIFELSEIDSAAQWLYEKSCHIFPESDFAKLSFEDIVK